MCKYCNFLANGDTADDYEDVVYEKATLKMLLEDTKELTVEGRLNVFLSGGVWHDPSSGEWSLSVSISDDYDPEIIKFTSVESKINFCPMCGRHLEAWKAID